ncbi:VWA domain-containing protein [Brachyspira hampsonii]|uniref:VWA domain-containing protein n=1 Tax=Brachyspira hampsonii TaxID=1287055 RepID=A0AAC9TVC3_9SPIR|nr:VWA domain-containing protein [Brachyspira hampsonii]ASJ22696.1 VWA domain-containing protein [Brachyspira hampsonii]OEJ15598.1 VWA domain-containing protein [Brachyspira hampsonii]
MKQFDNDSYKDEIKKTEIMAKGVFNSAFNNLSSDERLSEELEIKITKWKKDLNVFINDNNPYQDNKTELDIALKKLKNTSREDIFNDLNSLDALSIDTKFWRYRLSNSDDLNILKKNVISVWEKTYNKKNNDWLVSTVKERRDKFISDIESWINLLKKLKYMSNILRIKTGVLWDFRVGELEEEDISLLKRWVDFINKYKDIEIICDSIGRRIDIEKSLRNVEFKNTYSNTNKKISSKEEIVGIYFAKDIENVIPEELSLLCSKESEKLFKLKYIENRLMCFDKSAYVFNDDMDYIVRAGYREGKGDMIICIDTSGSMKGINEYIAKAVMFKMVMQALSENRNAYLINFSTEIYTCKFTKENGIEDLIKFLKLSYHGGSDIYKALYEANRMMNTSSFKNADVLVLSDFIMEDMPNNLVTMCSRQKNNGNKYFAVSIGKFPFGYSYRKVFNKHWIFDIDNGLKEIY